jgi:hypothetical protein
VLMPYGDDTEIPPCLAEKDRVLTNWKDPNGSDQKRKWQICTIVRSHARYRKMGRDGTVQRAERKTEQPRGRKGKGDIKYRKG